MEAALQDSLWISGEDFSLSDVCLAPYFQTLLQFGWTALYEMDSPKVAHWFARCQQRASYVSAVADDFPPELMAELQGRGQGAWGKIEAHLG